MKTEFEKDSIRINKNGMIYRWVDKHKAIKTTYKAGKAVMK